MGALTIEQLRAQVALSNPSMTSAEVRREAERVQSVLDGIEAEDALRASLAAQVAEEQAQQATEAQRRSEAFNDASAIVRASHPGWDDASVEMEAQRLAAENASAVAALDLRDSLADGIEPQSYALGRR
jgi:hypothetical protein